MFRWSLSFLVAVLSPLAGQELLPPVINYSGSDYGAGSQNWGVSSDSLGVVYVANNEGLLTYDGQRWSEYALPNETIIRSVFAHGGKVYTGSYEEFGYWEPDAYGELNYTSLRGLIKTAFDNEEFWEIIDFRGDILFRSFGKIYRYDGKTITTYKPDFLITALLVKDDRLLVGSKNGKVYMLKDIAFEPIADAALPNGYSVTSLAYFKGELIVGSRSGGPFTLRGRDYIPWGPAGVYQFLIRNELNKIAVYDKNKIIFGTVKGGVLCYNDTTGKTEYFHLGNGLQNNTVLALHSFGSSVWLGLDNGLDVIDLNAPITYYKDRTGELGAVYDIAFKDGKTYLASNTGVHVLDENGQHFMPGSQGQVWGFSELEGHLYVNHNRGIFEVRNGEWHSISEYTGSFTLIKVPTAEHHYLNATYNGIYLYELIDGDLGLTKSLARVSMPIKQLVFEGEAEVWAAHPYKGFFKFGLSKDRFLIEGMQNFGSDSLFKAYKTTLHHLPGNRIGLYNGGNWLTYNGITNTMQPFTDMAAYKNYSLISDGSGEYWFKNTVGKGYVFTDFKQDSLSIYDPLLEQRLVKGYVRAVKHQDQEYFITLNEGFAKIDLAKIRDNKLKLELPAPQLIALSDRDHSFPLTDDEYAISYHGAGKLIVQVAEPMFNNVRFEYQLSSGESGSLENGLLVLRNLAPGSHELKITPSLSGQVGEQPLTLTFSVLPPWYFSWPMLVAYLGIIILIIYIVYRINRKKLNQHRKLVEQKFIKEQQRKNEIAERNALRQEIEHKRKELANSTFEAVQRNKTLNHVKEQLETLSSNAEDRPKLKNIETKLNQMLNGKDNWEVFETQFKEINDSFFQDLLSDHPKLSSRDLKLCAYLKMNLATKEIAPLMAISPRGVEIHRYRLRKKLRLRTNTNLNKYLIERY